VELNYCIDSRSQVTLVNNNDTNNDGIHHPASGVESNATSPAVLILPLADVGVGSPE